MSRGKYIRTKECREKLSKSLKAYFAKGGTCWREGLTKEIDPRVANAAKVQEKPRETRTCAAPGCGNTFECKVTSKQKYCCPGHSMSGKNHSEETKKEMRKSHLEAYKNGRKRGMQGKHHSKETTRKMSKSGKGKHGKFNQVYHSGKDHHNWQGGVSKLPYPFSFNKDLKNQIRERDNHTCQLCERTQDQFHRKLNVHHINYDKDDLFELNLITLCSSCNSKVNSRRSFWEDYFTFRLLHGIGIIGKGI